MKIQGYNWIKANVLTASKLPEIQPGWTVRVHQKIQEGEKSRVQVFEGIVIGKNHKKEAGATITVRKIANGVGVEKVFPIYSPIINKIEVIKKAKVRRAKLYYLREKSAKATRKKLRNVALADAVKVEEEVPPETEAPKEETTVETKTKAPLKEA